MEVSSDAMVTNWIARIKRGDPLAAQQIWECYVERLLGLARKRLSGLPARMADEQDVLQSVFCSFFRRAQAGQFPQLTDRNDLWQLLVTISARKSQNLLRKEFRRKRGGGRIHGYVVPKLVVGDTASDGMDQLAAPNPTPEFAAIVAEGFTRLVDRLGDSDLRELALLKFEGFSNRELAERLNCSERTVERRLRFIRKIWEQPCAGDEL